MGVRDPLSAMPRFWCCCFWLLDAESRVFTDVIDWVSGRPLDRDWIELDAASWLCDELLIASYELLGDSLPSKSELGAPGKGLFASNCIPSPFLN